MKKILFVAKVNKIIQEMNEVLEEDYRVQFCSYNKPTIESMLSMSKPDIILISLIGAMGVDTSVFSFLHTKYPSIPVLTIGNQAEISRISDYLEMDQFDNILRPIGNNEVKLAVAAKLGNAIGGAGKASGAPQPPRRKLSTAERAAELMGELKRDVGGATSVGGVSTGNSAAAAPQASGGQASGAGGAAARSSAFGAAAGANASGGAAGESSSGKKRVLVVDDNAGMLRNVKTMLEDVYDISVAPSGVKAMAMIGKKMPDAILLDYEMPVVDGRQTMEMIRAEEDFAHIPILFLTGVNDREHIQSVIALRPAGYLLKPPVRETLIAAINKALER